MERPSSVAFTRFPSVSYPTVLNCKLRLRQIWAGSEEACVWSAVQGYRAITNTPLSELCNVEPPPPDPALSIAVPHCEQNWCKDSSLLRIVHIWKKVGGDESESTSVLATLWPELQVQGHLGFHDLQWHWSSSQKSAVSDTLSSSYKTGKRWHCILLLYSFPQPHYLI